MGETEHRQVRRDYVARDLNSSPDPTHPHFLCCMVWGCSSCLLQDSVIPSVQWTGCTQASDASGSLSSLPRSSPHSRPQYWQAWENPCLGAYRKTFSRRVP